jgi:hypothetical protein
MREWPVGGAGDRGASAGVGVPSDLDHVIDV